MKATLLTAVLALAGCAADDSNPIQSSTPRTVVVTARQANHGIEPAQAECQKYGRHARLAGRGGLNTWFFDCVD